MRTTRYSTQARKRATCHAGGSVQRTTTDMQHAHHRHAARNEQRCNTHTPAGHTSTTTPHRPQGGTQRHGVRNKHRGMLWPDKPPRLSDGPPREHCSPGAWGEGKQHAVAGLARARVEGGGQGWLLREVRLLGLGLDVAGLGVVSALHASSRPPARGLELSVRSRRGAARRGAA
jgi:hypothetical protein